MAGLRSERAEMAFSALGWGLQALHSDRGSCRKSLYLDVGGKPCWEGEAKEGTKLLLEAAPQHSHLLPVQDPSHCWGPSPPAPHRPILISQTSTQASLPPRLPLGSHPVRLQTPSCPFIAFLGTQTVLVIQLHQCKCLMDFYISTEQSAPQRTGFVPASWVPNRARYRVVSHQPFGIPTCTMSLHKTH